MSICSPPKKHKELRRTHIRGRNLYKALLNDKEFCFSLIGLKSTFLVVPQSEFTSREPQGVYSGFQRCPTRDEISFPVSQSKNFKIIK